MSGTDVLWKPHPGPQTEFFQRGEFEVLYGGQAGGGKSDALIAEALIGIEHSRYRCVMLRRTFPRTQELLDRAHDLYPHFGAVYKAAEHRWHFPSGAKIQFGHMETTQDKRQYQGKEYQRALFDELTEFEEEQYLFLFSRLRSSFGIVSRVRSTANPGGVGHEWVKRRFRIGSIPPKTPIITEMVDQTTGQIFRASRVFIPSSVYDNPSIIDNDPLYIQRLLQLPPLERDRLLYGRWDTFEGQAFPEINFDIHSFDFDVPPEWETFGAFDWGYSRPWSYGLYAVDFDGGVWRFAEAYGAQVENGLYTEKGLRLTDEEIADRILALEADFKVRPRYRVADPAIWSRKPGKGNAPPGPSPQETMFRRGVPFIKADNNRLNGRAELHNRFRVDDDGVVGLRVHKRCKAWWQYFPELRENPKNPEEIDDTVPDHVGDETRYGIMSRPLRPVHSKVVHTGTFQHERKKYLDSLKHIRRATAVPSKF